MSTGKEIKDMAASIRARLLKIARQLNIDFNRVLLIYLQQCFLDRLARSRYKEQFILKGGLLFYGVEPLIARPTRDMDFLGKNVLNQPGRIEAAIREILTIELPDGVTFLTQDMRSEIITERRFYSGVRVFVPAELSKAKQKVQIDVGFGDAIIPGTVEFDYPALLKDDPIKISAYSWNSVIAEKMEAIVSFSDLSSRMKDYYDIFYLQDRFNFNGNELSEAIEETFKRRETDLSGSDYIFSEDFASNQDRQKQWRAFLGKNDLKEPADFFQVIKHLKQFLAPVISAIIRKENFAKKWDFARKRWL